MSSLINKVKDAVGGNKHANTNTTSTHGYNTGNTTHDPSMSTTGHNTTAGPHGSNMGNQIDPRVDSDRDGRGGMGHGNTYGGSGLGTTSGSHNTTAGPHNSNLMNQADPRVDSDRDGRSGMGGSHNTHGTSGFGSNTHGTSSHNTTAGPHNSNLMNQADPRVDSDRDGRSGMGGSHNTHGTSGLGSNTHGTAAHNNTTTAGPHNSNLLNKVDPRVDSDMDGRSGMGRADAGHGTHQGHGASGLSSNQPGYGTTGNHSGMTGAAGTQYGQPGLVTESKRVHDNKLLNKLDPGTKLDSQGNPI